MSSWIIQVGPKCKDKCPYKDIEERHMNLVKTGSELIMMQLHTKEDLESTEAGCGKKGLSARALRKNVALPTS